MLVLGRKVGEQILIDNGNIQVKVLSVKGNQVCLGINAPKEIPVHREEIWLKIKNETEAHENEATKRTISSLYTGRNSDKEGILKTG